MQNTPQIFDARRVRAKRHSTSVLTLDLCICTKILNLLFGVIVFGAIVFGATIFGGTIFGGIKEFLYIFYCIILFIWRNNIWNVIHILSIKISEIVTSLPPELLYWFQKKIFFVYAPKKKWGTPKKFPCWRVQCGRRVGGFRAALTLVTRGPVHLSFIIPQDFKTCWLYLFYCNWNFSELFIIP